MTVDTIAPFASATPAATLSSAGGVLRVLLALALVLAAVFVSAWMSRRVRSLGAASGRNLEVLAQLALGARERAVLVRVGDQQLLLGVAPGSVTTLHVLQNCADIQTSAAAGQTGDARQPPSFKALLLRSLGK